ncbi:MAG: cysteine desulfurase family protein [Bacteroidota bacterium]
MIYLDNAATTPMDSEVIAAMHEVMNTNYGNPSSVHWYGRKSRVLVEEARVEIASIVQAKPSEIYFTSSATEAISTAIYGAVRDLGIRNIITSAIEHHAVLHTLDAVHRAYPIQVSFVRLDKNGLINFDHLQELLDDIEPALVILMHANNEIGTLYPIARIAKLCKNYNSFYLTDTVQTMGKYAINFLEMGADFATCSAHKFHGPKGSGFLYISDRVSIKPLIDGGGQERNLRSGTENVCGIAGMAKAFEVAYRDLEMNANHIAGLKSLFVEKLQKAFPDIIFNAASHNSGLYNIIHVSFPNAYRNQMLLQNLDIHGIATSGGSACASGTVATSHVLSAIHAITEMPSVRFSLSKFNTLEEVDDTMRVLKKILL